MGRLAVMVNMARHATNAAGEGPGKPGLLGRPKLAAGCRFLLRVDVKYGIAQAKGRSVEARESSAGEGGSVIATPQKKPGSFWWRYWPRFLFLIPFVALMWVPFYNWLDPELWGIPFFYWYQLGWVLLSAAIVIAVYVIDTRVTGVAKAPPEDLEVPGPPGDVL
jgi:hypothetical protein